MVKEGNPTLLYNGQVRVQCPFRENHSEYGHGAGEQSMFLSPAINRYHCFSCRAKGMLSHLLVSKYKVSAFEVLKFAFRRPDDKETEKEEFEIDEPWIIKPSPIFSDRDFSDEVQKYFKVGMTLDGYTIIPFFDADGYLQGLQKRKDTRTSRFLQNTKKFPKHLYLYNYNPEEEEATIVEGYSDVFRLWMFGEHAESTLGTSLTEEQAQMLSVHKVLYVATDMDKPGRDFADHIYKVMSAYPIKLLFIPYVAKDPGEVLSRRDWYSYKRAATGYAAYKYAIKWAEKTDYYTW